MTTQHLLTEQVTQQESELHILFDLINNHFVYDIRACIATILIEREQKIRHIVLFFNIPDWIKWAHSFLFNLFTYDHTLCQSVYIIYNAPLYNPLYNTLELGKYRGCRRKTLLYLASYLSWILYVTRFYCLCYQHEYI